MSEYLSVKCWHCQHHQKVRVGKTGEGTVYFTSACAYGKEFGLKECAFFKERELMDAGQSTQKEI